MPETGQGAPRKNQDRSSEPPAMRHPTRDGRGEEQNPWGRDHLLLFPRGSPGQQARPAGARTPRPPEPPDRTTGWCPHEESNQTQHHSEQAPLGPGFPLLPACAHKAPVAQELGAAPMHAGDLSGELQPTWCTQVERRQVAVSGLRPEPSGPTYVGGHTQV